METLTLIQILGPLAAVASALAAWWGIHRTAVDSRARSQPSMVVELDFAPNSQETIQLLVRNTGPTPARNVAVTFDPPLPDTKWGSHAWMLRHRYAEPIGSIGPGQVFRNSWWFNDYSVKDAERRLETNVHGLPAEITVTVEYSGLGRKRITDAYNLNVWHLQMETYPVSSASALGRLGGIEKQLRYAVSSLATLADHPGHT